MKKSIKWLKAVQLRIPFLTFVFEKPSKNASMAGEPVKGNLHIKLTNLLKMCSNKLQHHP